MLLRFQDAQFHSMHGRNICSAIIILLFTEILLLVNCLLYLQNSLLVASALLCKSLVSLPSKVRIYPSTLKPFSLSTHGMMLFSSSEIFTLLWSFVEHHVLLLATVCPPNYWRILFHSLYISCSSAGLLASSQTLSAKTSMGRENPPLLKPLFCFLQYF